MQTDVAIDGNEITGTLNYIEDGLAETGPLAGDGYFLALQWGDPAEDITSLKVGLEPSTGTGLVEAIDDPDRNGVFKIDNVGQKFVIVQSGNGKRTQRFDLSGLTLEDVEGA